MIKILVRLLIMIQTFTKVAKYFGLFNVTHVLKNSHAKMPPTGLLFIVYIYIYLSFV